MASTHTNLILTIKRIVYIRKGLNSHRIGLVHQHGPRFIVLEHKGCVPVGWSGSGSVIQDHSDDGASKEPMIPWPKWIRRFLWCTMILDHWSGSGSPQTHAPQCGCHDVMWKRSIVYFLTESNELLIRAQGTMVSDRFQSQDMLKNHITDYAGLCYPVHSLTLS